MINTSIRFCNTGSDDTRSLDDIGSISNIYGGHAYACHSERTWVDTTFIFRPEFYLQKKYETMDL